MPSATEKTMKLALSQILLCQHKRKELTDFNKNQLAQDSVSNANLEKCCQNVVMPTPEALKTPCFQGLQPF